MSSSEMLLTPDDLIGREFPIGLRGYDRDQVDVFLQSVAEAWRDSLASGSPSGRAKVSPSSANGHRSDAEAQIADEIDSFLTPGEDLSEIEVPAGATSSNPSLAEIQRDRTTAYAERMAAELDRASARTELAQAQEKALQVVDASQRRAEAVLDGARAKAEAEASAVLDDTRSRLAPLLEQEKAVRARLMKLHSDIKTIADTPLPKGLELPKADLIVTDTENDPDTPEATFPVGYGSVKVDTDL